MDNAPDEGAREYRIAGKLCVRIIPVTVIAQNCLVISPLDSQTGGARTDATVIDPGGDVEQIFACLDEHGLHAAQIIITHLHSDHIGALDALAAREKPGLVLGPHRTDEVLLGRLQEQAAMIGMDNFPPPQIENWAQDGQTVHIAGFPFVIHHCPGHTPGHIILESAALAMAIVGDTLFAGSVGRTDLPFADPQLMVSTIKNRILTLDDAVTFFPGHGPVSTIGAERAHNPFLQNTR